MDKTLCAEIMTWLEGVYGRTFHDEVHKAAWSLLAGFPNDVAAEAAKRMVAAEPEFFSPARWLHHAEGLEAERRHAAEADETQRRLDATRQLPHASAGSPGYQEFKKALAALDVGKNAPKYPGMGLTEILAVRSLERSGIPHEEAFAAVRARRPAGPVREKVVGDDEQW